MIVLAEKHYPEVLEPVKLDDYLHHGWYRMGQSIFTTHFLSFAGQMYSAIWIRLDLAQHGYSKSQRKLLRRNGQQFTIKYAPFRITPEKEALYQVYRAEFDGYIARSLADSLLDEEDFNIYQTVEAQIYDGNQLVGLSFFDVGKNAAASILGIYHPRYKKHSLGYYTMLLEMEFCRRNGIQYYYPGYVVPGYDRFDYKLRIGPVDYLSLSQGEWLPYTSFTDADIPLLAMQKRLHELGQALKSVGFRNKLYGYPLFETNLFGFFEDHNYLHYPALLALRLEPNAKSDIHFLTFDLQTQEYLLLHCASNDDFRFFLNESYLKTFESSEYLLELKVIEEVIYRTPHQSNMVRWIYQRYSPHFNRIK